MNQTTVPTSQSSIYIGTKTVIATPMSQEEFDALMTNGGIEVEVVETTEEPSDSAGFMVEVPEGVTNHIAYAGHISWVPFAEFTYRHMGISNNHDLPAFLQRLLVEQAQLDQRLRDLVAFTKDDRFLNLVSTQRELLLEQCRVMYRYSYILDTRIEGHLAQIEHKKQAQANASQQE